jgi:AmiR/NasT family two-component response regulator
MSHKVQIDDIVRDATPEEIQAIEAQQAEATARLKELTEKATAKAALLERLGITADEAALLVQ